MKAWAGKWRVISKMNWNREKQVKSWSWGIVAMELTVHSLLLWKQSKCIFALAGHMTQLCSLLALLLMRWVLMPCCALLLAREVMKMKCESFQQSMETQY